MEFFISFFDTCNATLSSGMKNGICIELKYSMDRNSSLLW